ncbi:hypothetical protein N9118_01700 [Akkermansiaceae bacterium]|jgi:hypothetical protein|nr:hypothetical protein [Akkermansiaceae bacterium]
MRSRRKAHTTASGLIESLLEAEIALIEKHLVAGMRGSASLKNPTSVTDPLIDALKANYLR